MLDERLARSGLSAISKSGTALLPERSAVEAEMRGAAVDAEAWIKRHRRIVCALDFIAIVGAILFTSLVRFGEPPTGTVSGSEFSYPAASAMIGLVWWVALGAIESRSKEILGVGPEEYQRVLKGSFYASGIVAIVSYLAGAQLSRLFFIALLPIGVILLLMTRWVARTVLNRERGKGGALVATLVIGTHEEVRDTVRDMRRHAEAGFQPTAISLTDHRQEQTEDEFRELPVIALDQVSEGAASLKLGAVAIAGGLSRAATRRLAWHLENSHVQLMVVPRMTDVAGPRLRYSNVEGLKLVHVALPRFSGWNFWMKRSFDVAFATLALLVSSPLLMAVAIAIKLDDGGPVLFKQERVGRGGHPFIIHKFRTMCENAEDKIADLIKDSGGGALLFKIEEDPRITRVGRTLRKFSLDELPQFWTVLVGGMSIVGPRPQVEREVAEYSASTHRRLLIKPGITGLWQVSGRSQLSVEDSIRLDLRYVENWSLTGDLAIVLRTIKVVLFPDGAY